MSATEIDGAKAEEFAGKMLGYLNGAALSLMISAGYQAGLFETMAGLPASTSEEIADASGLNERYIREWLAGMTVGGIVEHDPEEGTYRLPPEHAAFLTKAAGPDDLGMFAQFIALFAEVERDVVEAFRHGNGIPYSRYPRFQELMAGMSAAVLDATLVDVVLPLVPGLVDRLEAGGEALDIGCGHGHAVNLIARAFPSTSVTGYDLSEEAVDAARAEALDLGLSNSSFGVKDIRRLDEPERYDLVTAFDVVHDLPDPAAVLASIHGALKPGGVFLMVDIAASSHVHENLEHPLAPMLYTSSVFHCMSVSLAQGGVGLGTMWGQQLALSMLAEAGFDDVEVKRIEGDIFNGYYVARKS
jgi:2-polyprenyl-3-methyl-5-hydroxy-6-metoxy-1,4-benzoquinol methylase